MIERYPDRIKTVLEIGLSINYYPVDEKYFGEDDNAE
jgi:hypothetical protein